MTIFLLTLFPQEVHQFFLKGIFKRGSERGLFDFRVIDIRDFADNSSNRVDHYPFGGKKGMLLRADILAKAIKSIDQYESYRIIYTCPKGNLLTQPMAESLAAEKSLSIICGYYEGIDERLFEMFSIERVSIARAVLSSGEVPALAIAEATLRLIPGVVGKQASIEDDSLLTGLLEYPQYTVPRTIDELNVPDILVSGHHGDIDRWRRKESLKTTLFLKPELLHEFVPDSKDQTYFAQILQED